MTIRVVLLLAAVLLGGAGPESGPGADRAALMRLHRGGTLRLLATSAAGSIDPQINDTGQFWQIYATAYDGLLATRKAAGAAGLEIVPDLAAAMPVVTDGGRTYVFQLRPGIRFSDGRVVRAGDVAASFRRLFRVAGPTAGSFYTGILGADACLRDPTHCTLPGVVADDAAGRVTFHLRAPDPEFPIKLTLPPASALPADAPGHDSGTMPLPGTGAYRIVSYDPDALLRLERNPYFHEWNAAAQPDGYPDAIEQRYGLEVEAEVTQVENGQADALFDQPPQDRLAELGTRFAARVHLNPSLATRYLALNTRLKPFDDIRVRRAVNFAVDRAALVKLAGGRHLAEPTCQILPPGLPGYAPYCPYPHDLARARQLVAASGTAGQKITIVTDGSPVEGAIGGYLQSVLRDLGYEVGLRAISGSIEFTYVENSGNKVQAGLTDWSADYPAPSDFLHVLFACEAFHPQSDASLNVSAFCDPAIDARMQTAMAETDPARAAMLWQGIDRAVTDQAPVAELFVPRFIDVLSARVGNYRFNTQFRWLISQSWVR